jgi:hypothetical protein
MLTAECYATQQGKVKSFERQEMQNYKHSRKKES